MVRAADRILALHGLVRTSRPLAIIVLLLVGAHVQSDHLLVATLVRLLLLLPSHSTTRIVQQDTLAIICGTLRRRIQRQLNIIVYDELLLLLVLIILALYHATWPHLINSIAHRCISATRE